MNHQAQQVERIMTEKKEKKQELAVVRIRGSQKVNKKIVYTLEMLHLKKVNNCILIDNTDTNLGMIKKCKDYITWGEINVDTKKLLEKRKNKKVFTLAPPKGGFERKGIKKPFNIGGVLGFRGDKINILIKKMI